jgi:hypothetical protein
MRRLCVTSFLIILTSIFNVAPISAQEGYPLKGSWIGEWAGNEDLGDFVLIVMDWDGENVSGTINPGTDNIVIENVTLEPSSWTVIIEGGGYTLSGRIEQLELPSRSILGTWKHGSRSGALSLSRQ